MFIVIIGVPDTIYMLWSSSVLPGLGGILPFLSSYSEEPLSSLYAEPSSSVPWNTTQRRKLGP